MSYKPRPAEKRLTKAPGDCRETIDFAQTRPRSESGTASRISFTKEGSEEIAVVVFSFAWGRNIEMVLVDLDRPHRRDWAGLDCAAHRQARSEAPP